MCIHTHIEDFASVLEILLSSVNVFLVYIMYTCIPFTIIMNSYFVAV